MIAGLNTLPDRAGLQDVVITTETQGTLGWSGSLELNPLRSEGRAAIKGSHFPLASAYLKHETGFELVAPLAANHNDKGTAFAGSIATLAVVTGWAVGVLTARALGHEVDVAATRCALDFERPVDGDLHARCRWPDADARSRLQRGLARHGLARLPLEVSVAAEAAGAPGARCVLHYAVRRREDVRASN